MFGAAVASPVFMWLVCEHSEALGHVFAECLSFITLLASLYVVSGAVHVSGDLEGRPHTNAGLLLLGAVLANVIGTTGASVLLVRLLLRTNRQRRHAAHIPVFFILVVSNGAGLLTPLGDPPLFLGYLAGVPFGWSLSLWPVWALAVGWLLLAFLVVDTRAYRREAPSAHARDATEREPLRIAGKLNIALLGGVVVAALAPTPEREVALLALTLLSLWLADDGARRANGFKWGPMAEVAIVFAAVFVTMVPALALLAAHGADLGLRSPWQFFLACGAMSSVLDNAPTYLAFLSTARGLGLPSEVAGVPDAYLTAISCGAVLMGANTYIGNGPNLIVKAIAEECGYQMPTFVGYAWRALVLLAPVYLVITVWLALATG